MPSNSARVIEMEVTSRLEAMLARIKGIKEISSTSGNGWGRITLELDKHTNIDAARFEASTIVRQTWPDLPEELSYPILEMSRPDDKESRPFMSYTLNASATPIFIQRFAEDQIKPRLSSVQGIYRIDVSGACPARTAKISSRTVGSGTCPSVSMISSSGVSRSSSRRTASSQHRPSPASMRSGYSL